MRSHFLLYEIKTEILKDEVFNKSLKIHFTKTNCNIFRERPYLAVTTWRERHFVSDMKPKQEQLEEEATFFYIKLKKNY